MANDGIILSDAQVAELERKKNDDEACGEIETLHLGYLGPQDTLYTTKTPITAADALNNRVLPFFEQQELPMLRILTDRGTKMKTLA